MVTIKQAKELGWKDTEYSWLSIKHRTKEYRLVGALNENELKEVIEFQKHSGGRILISIDMIGRNNIIIKRANRLRIKDKEELRLLMTQIGIE